MDIAVIGPEKFAFQDMACIELALGYRRSGTVSLVPEPVGGEDASLTWAAHPTSILEVQVKGAAGTAGIVELADYLAHYPSRKANGSLLERLLNDDDRHALFILTARCTDDLAPLLVRPPLSECPTARSAPYPLAQTLRDEFARVGNAKPSKKASALDVARRQDLATLAKRPVADFERVLARTSLTDQQTAETIEVRLHAAMRSEHFDTLSIRGILARLTDLLAQTKRTQSDALGAMLRELLARAPSAVRPVGYLDRGIETDLLARLHDEHVLLLAGPPRAGKSWTVRAIGGLLQMEGYEVRQGSFVEEAERFLTDITGAERLYILDDPLGAREASVDASARLTALRGLSERIPNNRRLIVAQSEQVILQVRAVPTLSVCPLGSRHWRRLEPLSVERAQAVWRAAGKSQAVPLDALTRVEKLIEHEPNLRDPGALVFLGQTWSELPDRPLDEEILLQARRDASDFARTLMAQAPVIGEMLAASALATTTVAGAADAELAFIVGGEGDRPALQEGSRGWSFGANRGPPPTYATKPSVSADQRLALDTLQRKRVLEQHDNRLNFTHPYLRAGAQTLIMPDIPTDRDRILAQIERAIACCSPITSLAAARNLRWLRLAFAHDDTHAVFGAAQRGVHSLYPATRDCCFQFLLEFADQLPDEFRREIHHWSERVVVDLADIDVAHGIGFISDQRDWFSKASPLDEVSPYLQAIEDGEPLALDLSLSHRLLQSLSDNPLALTHTAVRRFLRADEAVVRASAAGIWCRVPRDSDDDILARLEADAVPSVSIGVLRELARHWDDLEAARRERILNILVQHASSTGCASVLLSRLVLFNRVEHFGERPPWRIFTELTPVVIRNLPLSVDFRDGRLNAAIDDALAQAPAGTLSPLIEAWASRILLRLDDHYFLDDFELAIVEPLLAGVEADTRFPILRDLLNVADTGARVVTTRRLAEGWDALSPAEHALLRDTLAEDRPDARWLAASVLTLTAPPEELVVALTDDPETLALNPDKLEHSLGPELFAACVRMYVGRPQPLWWYATHHSDSKTWAAVVRHLARASDHPLHAVGFYEIADFGKRGELADVIDALPEAQLPDTLERLLNFKLMRTGDWRPDAWRRLFARAEAAGLLDAFMARIDLELDGILEEVRDIRYWLRDKTLETRVFGLLPNDARAIVSTSNLLQVHEVAKKNAMEIAADEGTLRTLFSELCAREMLDLENKPPRIFGTWGVVADIFKTIGVKAETLELVEAKRLEALARHHTRRKRRDEELPPVELDGWVDQAKLSD